MIEHLLRCASTSYHSYGQSFDLLSIMKTPHNLKKQQKFSFSRANTFLKPLLSEPSYLLQNKGNILLCLCEIFL